jgi:hypothetical protein
MFATVELWCHPRLRNHCKEYYKKNAILETKPTQKGTKELDLFHPSYRVKRVKKFVNELRDAEDAEPDLFLDILQNE